MSTGFNRKQQEILPLFSVLLHNLTQYFIMILHIFDAFILSCFFCEHENFRTQKKEFFMQITRPDYYKNFSCIADACPDTCCAGWQIVIDEKSLKKYKNIKGPFRNRLHNDINWKEHVFCQYDRRCAFLNEENLCDIYSEAGKGMLCDTCRKYPRHIEEFEGLREYSLSLSCPEAARIILGNPEKVTFHTARVPSAEENYEDFDYLLFTALMDTRDSMILLLQSRQIPLHLRLWKLLAMAHDLQLCLDKNELYRWNEIQALHQKSGFSAAFAGKVRGRTESAPKSHVLFPQMWEHIFSKMEVLREDWPAFLKQILPPLYKDAHRQLLEDFEKAYPDWKIQGEQLMVYWLYTYFAGAVYDGEIFAKMKMAVVCTLLIRELDMGVYLKNGRVFCLADQISICYRFSRELEHSDLNLNALEELLAKDELFSLENLFRIC